MPAHRRILIVDDEEDLTWGLSRSLAKTPDLEVACVPSGDQALELLQSRSFDLVLSDVRMPGRSGLQLMRDIRERFPQIKVIIMTAHGSSETREQVEAQGGFFYIEKPFDVGYLKQIILDALELDDNGCKGYASIRELVLLNCSNKRSGILVINKNGERGAIYFWDGEIVHAECGALQGERAFFNIISWGGGTFTIQPNSFKPHRTISRNWKSLLHQSI